MIYRADIDGLRTIAIIPVILFHAKVPYLTGGFVGVDVFFAISGFLITSIIYPQVIEQRFSFFDFYAKRARRLLPAGFAVIFFSIILTAFLFPPDKFTVVVNSAISSFLFVSNMFFWQTSGYFNPVLEIQPLLHTWSLGVEEQFYFVFPIFLAIIAAFSFLRKFLVWFTAMACLISLTIAVVYAPSSTSYVGFYVLPARFYEMGLGALLAIVLINAPVHVINYLHKRLLLREIGLLMIVVAIFTFNASMSFPSFYALLPVIGSLLIIVDHSRRGMLYQFLISSPIVFIGLISYSLYLWHWPLWVGVSWLFEMESAVNILLYLGLTFAVAYISWRFIENPFRQAHNYKKLRLRITAIFSVVVLSLTVGFFAINGNQSVLPITKEKFSMYENALISEPFRDKCTDTKRNNGEYAICELVSHEQPKYRILLWGDSHASALMSSLVNFNLPYSIDAFNTSGCPPLFGIQRKNANDCLMHNEYMKEYLQNNPKQYDLILAVGAWDNYIELDLLSTDSTQDSTQATRDAVLQSETFFEELELPYLYMAQMPKQAHHVPDFFFKNYNSDDVLSSSYLQHQLKVERFIAFFRHPSVVLDFSSALCNKERCMAYDNEMIYYKDAHHISVQFAENLTPLIKSAIHTKLDKKGE